MPLGPRALVFWPPPLPNTYAVPPRPLSPPTPPPMLPNAYAVPPRSLPIVIPPLPRGSSPTLHLSPTMLLPPLLLTLPPTTILIVIPLPMTIILLLPSPIIILFPPRILFMTTIIILLKGEGRYNNFQGGPHPPPSPSIPSASFSSSYASVSAGGCQATSFSPILLHTPMGGSPPSQPQGDICWIRHPPGIEWDPVSSIPPTRGAPRKLHVGAVRQLAISQYQQGGCRQVDPKETLVGSGIPQVLYETQSHPYLPHRGHLGSSLLGKFGSSHSHNGEQFGSLVSVASTPTMDPPTHSHSGSTGWKHSSSSSSSDHYPASISGSASTPSRAPTVTWALPPTAGSSSIHRPPPNTTWGAFDSSAPPPPPPIWGVAHPTSLHLSTWGATDTGLPPAVTLPPPPTTTSWGTPPSHTFHPPFAPPAHPPPSSREEDFVGKQLLRDMQPFHGSSKASTEWPVFWTCMQSILTLRAYSPLDGLLPDGWFITTPTNSSNSNSIFILLLGKLCAPAINSVHNNTALAGRGFELLDHLRQTYAPQRQSDIFTNFR